MAGFLRAAIIEEGSRWEAVRRAGAAPETQGAPLPHAAEELKERLVSTRPRGFRRHVPSAGVDSHTFGSMAVCSAEDIKIIPRVVLQGVSTLVVFHR